MRYIELTKEKDNYSVNYVPAIKGVDKLKNDSLNFLLIHNFLSMDDLETGERIYLSKNGDFSSEEIRDINNTFRIYSGAKKLELVVINFKD